MDTMTDEHQYTCRVWGPTSNDLDCIVKECLLPDMDIGEWIIFHEMGAYSMVFASSFNGMAKPKCYYRLPTQEWYGAFSFYYIGCKKT